MYKVSAETEEIARQLMLAVAFIVIFMSSNNIMTKGVLRGGGDTRFLMVADILFLWVVSIPLGALAGLVLHLPPFWIYVCLKLDQIIKAFWWVIIRIPFLGARGWILVQIGLFSLYHKRCSEGMFESRNVEWR